MRKGENSIHYSKEGTHFTKAFRDSELPSKVWNYKGQTYLCQQLMMAVLFRIKGQVIFKDQQSRDLLECL